MTSHKKFLKINKLLVILFFLITVAALYPQKIEKLEFNDRPINDILLALADYKGISIITDETVGGNATYSFFNIEIDKAIEVFLSTYKLYLTIKNNVYYVSRIRVQMNPTTQKVSMDAENVNINLLLNAISKAINKTILNDPLPLLPLDIHATDISTEELLRMLIVRAPNYKLEVTPNYFYVKAEIVSPGNVATNADFTNLKKTGIIYSINIQKKRYQELLTELFVKEKKEYVLLMQRDVIIDYMFHENKTFEELLSLIMERVNADYVVSNNIYYIYEIQQRDILKKYVNYEYIQLNYLSPQDIQRLMPPDLGNSRLYRIDQNTNSIILSGSPKEIEPIKQFIAMLDKPLGGNAYYRYDLDFTKAMNVRNLVPNKYKQKEIITIPETNSVIFLLATDEKKYMDEFIALLDENLPSTQVVLKYIKADDFMKNLPPTVAKEDIVLTGDPTTIFIKGTDKKIKDFLKELAILDQPTPQIRYQVFVVSYSRSETNALNQGKDPTISIAPGTTAKAFATSLSNIIGLSFDIPSVLGIATAINLNFALSNSDARVMTDTILYGLSGQKISFQDTTVSRYREPATNPEGGTGTATAAGPVREITTGFILTINGWASGDSMVTMEINIKISKQGSEGEIKEGNLGSTFDKVLNTTVRTKSGEPFKIGGLMKQDKSKITSTVPILGKIPILKYFFEKTTDTDEQSEIVVYILPQIVKSNTELADTSRRIELLYNKYFKL